MPENSTPDLSLVIPLLNEQDSLPELVDWILRVCEENHLKPEIVMIDDGSTDNSWQVIKDLAAKYDGIRAIRFQRNYGKSAALNVGFEAVTAPVVITMDADLQDSPDEIPELYRMITRDGFDLVSGWKKKRHDNAITKNLPSKLYNAVNRRVSGVKLHDMNCGLKAYKAGVVKSVEVYGEMHRYIPVLAKREGFNNIGEKVVEHRARQYGQSKFGMERFINGFLDLLTVNFTSRFGKKPMHFFGLWGTVMFVLGFLLFAWIGGDKLWAVYHNLPARNIADVSAFYIALTAMIIGTQLFLAGFVAEMVGRNNPERNRYHISETI